MQFAAEYREEVGVWAFGSWQNADGRFSPQRELWLRKIVTLSMPLIGGAGWNARAEK